MNDKDINTKFNLLYIILGLMALTLLLMNLLAERHYTILNDKITFINDDSLNTINEGLGDINDNIIAADNNNAARYMDLKNKTCGDNK